MAYTSKVVKDCHEALKTLAVDNKVTLLWVPGHMRVLGDGKPIGVPGKKLGRHSSGQNLHVA